MSGLELNKLAAAILLAGIIAMAAGFLADGLYHPVTEPAKRGYSIAGAEEDGAGGETAAADAGPVNILAFMGQASAEAGKALTKKCAACHNFGKGEANKTGPHLYGIVGAKQGGHAPDFAYSDAMKSKGRTWDFQELSEFLTKPKAYVPGTKMAFAGLAKPEDRANVIEYLRTLSDSPMAVPAYDGPPGGVEEKPADTEDAATDGKAGGETKEGAKATDEANKAVDEGKTQSKESIKMQAAGAEEGTVDQTTKAEEKAEEASPATSGAPGTDATAGKKADDSTPSSKAGAEGDKASGSAKSESEKGAPADKAGTAATRDAVKSSAAAKEAGGESSGAGSTQPEKSDSKAATTQPADATTREGAGADADSKNKGQPVNPAAASKGDETTGE